MKTRLIPRLAQTLAAGLVVIYGFAHAGEFTWKPADPDVILSDGCPIAPTIIGGADDPVKDLPHLGQPVHDPVSMAFGFNATEKETIVGDRGVNIPTSYEKLVPALLFKSDKDQKTHDRLAVDMNGDGKLTKEEVLRADMLDKPLTITLDGRTSVSVFAKIEQKRARYGFGEYPAHTRVALYPATWLEGTLRLNGKDLRAAILDMSGDRKPDLGDALLLDLNDNKKFDLERGWQLKSRPWERFSLAKCMIFEFAPYSPSVQVDDLKGVRIDLIPYEGKTGILKVTGSMIRKEHGSNISMWFTPVKSPGAAPVDPWVDSFGAWISSCQRLPIGKYEVGVSTFHSEQVYTEFTFSQPVEITEDKEFVLCLDRPDESVVSAVLKENKLQVNRSLKTTKHGITYRAFYPMVDGKPGPAVKPRIEVYVKGSGDKPVVTAGLEYG